MLSVKCEQPYFQPILFSTAKLRLGHRFSQFINKFKIGIFLPSFSQFTGFGIIECCSRRTYQFSPIHEKEGKLVFLNIKKSRLRPQIFPNLLKS